MTRATATTLILMEGQKWRKVKCSSFYTVFMIVVKLFLHFILVSKITLELWSELSFF